MSLLRGRDAATLKRVHAVWCPYCLADQGQWCHTSNDNLTYPHHARRRWAFIVEAAQELQESAR